MPNFPQYSPWQEASNSFGNLGGIAQNIAVGLAQQRYQQEMARQQMALRMQQAAQQAQLMQMHGKLYEAQTGLYNAQKTHYDTTTKQIQDAANAAQEFGTAVATTSQYGMPKYGDEGPIEHDIRMANLGNAPYEANRLAGVLSALGKQHIPENMAQIMYQNTSPQAQAALAMGGVKNLYNNVGSGVTAFPLPGSGNPVNIGGFTLAPEARRFAPETSFDLNSILGGVMGSTNQTPIATGGPRSFTPGADPRLRELATLGNIIKAGVGPGLEPDTNSMMFPIVQQAIQRSGQLMSNAPATHMTIPTTQSPHIGEVRKGYRFKGGDPSKQENWDKVQ